MIIVFKSSLIYRILFSSAVRFVQLRRVLELSVVQAQQRSGMLWSGDALWHPSHFLCRRVTGQLRPALSAGGPCKHLLSLSVTHLFYAVLGVKEVDQSFAHPFCGVWNNTVKRPLLLLCNHSMQSIVHLKSLFIIYPTACHLKPAWIYFSCWMQKHNVPSWKLMTYCDTCKEMSHLFYYICFLLTWSFGNRFWITQPWWA